MIKNFTIPTFKEEFDEIKLFHIIDTNIDIDRNLKKNKRLQKKELLNYIINSEKSF